MMYVGMPDPSQMPQQYALPPEQFVLPPTHGTMDILGVKIPAELLHSTAFWAFFLLVLLALVVMTYFKHRRVK